MFRSIYIVKYHVTFLFVTFVISSSKDPDISSEYESLLDRDPSIFYKRYLKKIRDLGEVSFMDSAQDCVQVLPSYSMSFSYDSIWRAYRDILERWCCTSMTLPMMEQENMWQWRPWNKRVEITFMIPGWRRSKYSNLFTTTISWNTRDVALNWVSKTSNRRFPIEWVKVSCTFGLFSCFYLNPFYHDL